MLVAAALLLASTLHAGPELPVSEAVRDAQPYVQTVEDVAAGDETALVVWREGHAVRGARVDRDGQTLDAVPLLIAYAPWEGAWVARGATNWLVVTSGPERIEATAVADDGTVGEPIVIATTLGIPRVAFDGNAYLVAWYDVTRQARIFGTRISAAGQVLESDIPITSANEAIILDLLPDAGGGFVLVGQQAEVLAIRLDAQAREAGRTALMPTIIWYDPAVGIDGEGHLLLGWRDSEGLAHVKRRGLEAVALGAENVDDFVTIGGTAYAVARADEKTSLWTMTGERVRELPVQTGTARAASFGNRVLVVTSYHDIHVTVLDASLQTIAPERLLYTEPQLQSGAAVAQAGGTRLVAWVEGDEIASRVMARLGDSAPAVIGEGYGVEAATDGRDFLVTWHDGNQLHARRVLRDGTLTEPVRAASRWVTGGSCVTSAGSDYVLGYITLTSFSRPFPRALWAQRVTRDGELSGDPVLLNPTTTPNGVACASSETTTLFAWYDEERRVRGATLSPGGTPSPRFEIGLGTFASVAAHGDGFVVAWPESPAGRASWATVSEGGTVGLPHTVESNTIRVAARPGGYLLLYGADPLRARPLDPNGDPSGPETVIANDAWAPAFAGGTLVYHRDTDLLPESRWRVFLRELDETGGRRRALRR
jgi:hypothetical protein